MLRTPRAGSRPDHECRCARAEPSRHPKDAPQGTRTRRFFGPNKLQFDLSATIFEHRAPSGRLLPRESELALIIQMQASVGVHAWLPERQPPGRGRNGPNSLSKLARAVADEAFGSCCRCGETPRTGKRSNSAGTPVDRQTEGVAIPNLPSSSKASPSFGRYLITRRGLLVPRDNRFVPKSGRMCP